MFRQQQARQPQQQRVFSPNRNSPSIAATVAATLGLGGGGVKGGRAVPLGANKGSPNKRNGIKWFVIITSIIVIVWYMGFSSRQTEGAGVARILGKLGSGKKVASNAVLLKTGGNSDGSSNDGNGSSNDMPPPPSLKPRLVAIAKGNEENGDTIIVAVDGDSSSSSVASVMSLEAEEGVEGIVPFQNCPSSAMAEGKRKKKTTDGQRGVHNGADEDEHTNNDEDELSFNEELISSLAAKVRAIKDAETALAMGHHMSATDKEVLAKAHEAVDVQLFAVWPGAMKHAERIITDISKRFVVLRIVTVDWTKATVRDDASASATSAGAGDATNDGGNTIKRNTIVRLLANTSSPSSSATASLLKEQSFLYFEENLWRLYSGKGYLRRTTMREKVGQCGGVGPFIVIIVADPNPKYEDEMTAHGIDHVNKNMYKGKKLYREWSGGGFRVHGTYSSLEADHDVRVLLGERPLAIAAKALLGTTENGGVPADSTASSVSSAANGIRGLTARFLADRQLLKAAGGSSGSSVSSSVANALSRASSCITTRAGTVGFPTTSEFFASTANGFVAHAPSDGSDEEGDRKSKRRGRSASAGKSGGGGGNLIAEVDGSLITADAFYKASIKRYGSSGGGASAAASSSPPLMTEMTWPTLDALWFMLSGSAATITAPTDGSITPYINTPMSPAADEENNKKGADESITEGFSMSLLAAAKFKRIDTSNGGNAVVAAPSSLPPFLSPNTPIATVRLDWRLEDRRRIARNNALNGGMARAPVGRKTKLINTYTGDEDGVIAAAALASSAADDASSTITTLVRAKTLIPIEVSLEKGATNGKDASEIALPSDCASLSSTSSSSRNTISAFLLRIDIIAPPAFLMASNDAAKKAQKKALLGHLFTLLSGTYGTILTSEGRAAVLDGAGRGGDKQPLTDKKLSSASSSATTLFNTTLHMKAARTSCHMAKGYHAIVEPFGVFLSKDRARMQSGIEGAVDRVMRRGGGNGNKLKKGPAASADAAEKLSSSSGEASVLSDLLKSTACADDLNGAPVMASVMVAGVGRVFVDVCLRV